MSRPTRTHQHAAAAARKSALLARMPRAFRPKLDRSQQVDLGLVHLENLARISRGEATVDTLWDWIESVLTWCRVAEVLQLGVDEMAAQWQICQRLQERYARTGRVGFDGPDYQAAKDGTAVMDELARLVDRPTAIAAATWCEAQVSALKLADGAQRTHA